MSDYKCPRCSNTLKQGPLDMIWTCTNSECKNPYISAYRLGCFMANMECI